MRGLGRRQRCRRYRDLSLEDIQALFSGCSRAVIYAGPAARRAAWPLYFGRWRVGPRL